MAAHQTTLPHRGTENYDSDDEAVPNFDPNDTADLLGERLQAWKHACGYLENYISTTEKIEKNHAKEYEKVLKTIKDPLKEGHHFDQSLGGIAGLFQNLRTNTEAISQSHAETAKAIDGQVMPILQRLHKEIKAKAKELSGGASKSAKTVSSARNESQKHIELLGQHTASVSSAGGKTDTSTDPYVLKRGIRHRLNKQIQEENNNRSDLLSVQDNFATFEAHVVQTFQSALAAFSQQVGAQSDRQKTMYLDMVGNAQKIPGEFEWMNFLHRYGNVMLDPSVPPRQLSGVSYPNEDHPSTQPVVAGTLERKSRALTGYKPGYYAVTQARYLHQFDSDDDLKKDPQPELSLYLPECTIGALSGEKFNIKGKDAHKGKVGTALAMSHEFAFKAQSPEQAEKWYHAIAQAAGASAVTTDPYKSPEASRQSSAAYPAEKTHSGEAPVAAQGGNVTGGQTVHEPAAIPTTTNAAAPASHVEPATATHVPGTQTTGTTGGSGLAPPQTQTIPPSS